MNPFHGLLRLYAALNAARTARALARPDATQRELLQRILDLYAPTELGRRLGLAGVTPEDFAGRVPATDADFYDPLFQEVRRTNAPGLVSTGELGALALSSRTTRAAKLIPYPMVLIKAFKRFEVALALHHMRETGRYDLLDGKLLITAGAPVVERAPSGLDVGVASGIMARLTPRLGRGRVLPSPEILAMTDWQAKVAATVREAIDHDVRVMTGIPTWVVPILEALLALAAERGKPALTAKDVWPNLQAYYWSGCPIGVYEPRLRQLFGPDVHFREVYAAAEAPIAYQHRLGQPGLLLDVERTYFEFQPADGPLDAPRLPLAGVRPGGVYRLFVTTLGGLCAYRLEDLVEVLAVEPPLIRFVGRETEELNLGGEKLPIRLMRETLAEVAHEHDAEVLNFFVCPSAGGQQAYHLYVEFRQAPADLTALAADLDARLIAAHGLYANMRRHDVALGPLQATRLASGTIMRFIGANRQFGQGKFLHLYGDRTVPERILS